MNLLSSFLLFAALAAVLVVILRSKLKKPRRIMREGKLLKSELVSLNGEMFQVEAISLVRSFRPIPVDEFDNIVQPLIG